MLKKVIKYIDYDGQERTETFYFNLNKVELAEMELSSSKDGGLSKYIQKIVEEKNVEQLMNIFKKIILMSYGVKSTDGKRFEKSKVLSDEFAQTEAFVELFLELTGNAEAAAAFINGIIPQNLNN